MDYPIDILPNINNKLIDCDLSNHYLIRYTQTNSIEDIIDSDTEQVRWEHICSPREQAADLSMSLLGIFSFTNIQIELTDEGKINFGSYCEPDILIETPVFQRDFILNENRLYWVLIIQNVNGQFADYNISNDSLRAQCRVCHTPMRWNYWHFSIRWWLDDKKAWWHEYMLTLNRSQREKLTKRLGHEARSLVAQFSKVESPKYIPLPYGCYKKQVV